MSLGGLIAALILLAASSTWRPLARVRQALGFAHLTSTGHIFLLLGYLLGWIAIQAESAPIFEHLTPIVSFMAGWVGFAVGIRFDLRVLRRVPGAAFVTALTPAFVVLAGVGGVAWLLLDRFVPPRMALAGALVVGVAAATTGPSLAGALRRRRGGRAPKLRARLRLMEFSAGLDDMLVAVVALFAFALYPSAPTTGAEATLSLAIALGGGAGLGGVTWLFLGGEANDDERLLLGIGMIAFASGLAAWLDLAPAALGALAGATLVNLPGSRRELFLNAVQKVERPALVILMTLVGFQIAPARGALIPALIALMTVLRGGLKHSAALISTRPLPPRSGLEASPGWTLGLLSQGALGIVVALSFHHVWGSEASLALLAAVAGASLFNEIIAPTYMLKALRERGGAR